MAVTRANHTKFRPAAAAWEKKGPKCALWEAVRYLFAAFEVSSMAEIYQGIAFGFKRPALNTLIDQGPVGNRSDTS